MPHMMGARGAAHTGLKFTDMKLDKKYLLGEEGQGMEIAIHSLSVSRAHIAASNLGMCQRMLEMSLARANDRITFGKPIASRQMIKREIAEMQMYTHALRCMVYDFGREYDADPNGKYIEEKAAMCKLFSIYSTRIVSDGMLEIFGGDGYFEDSPTARPSACTATPAPCGSRRAPLNVQRITIARNCQKFGGKVEYQL